MNKRPRQDTIIGLVRKRTFASQEELRLALRERGVDVTQATLSRDIAELGLVRTARGYQLAGQAGDQPLAEAELRKVLREFMLAAIPAGNLLAIKTPAGAAGTVGTALDRAALDDLIATLAGDDVVLAVAKTPAAAIRLGRRLHSIAG